MILASASSSSRHLFTILAVLAGGGLVAVGCSDQADPTAPPGVQAASHDPQWFGDGSITVDVRQGNTRYTGVLVTVGHREFGPFRGEGMAGDILKKHTVSGVATFDNLPIDEHGYCVHITAVSATGDALVGLGGGVDEEFIVPAAAQQGSTVNIAPGITERQGGGGNVRLVDFTEDNYRDNCTNAPGANAPPVLLTAQRPDASLRLSPANGATIEAVFQDLDGAVIPGSQVAGWLVIGQTPQQDPNWRGYFKWLPEDLRHDYHPGILVGVRAASQSGDKTVFQGLPRHEVAFEVLTNRPGRGLLVSTSRRQAGGNGSAAEIVAMEPLMCQMNRTAEPAAPGTATGGALEVVGHVFDGYRADGAFNRSNEIAIWYTVDGSGSDILRLRFKSTGGATQNLNIPYVCDANGCVDGPPSGSAAGVDYQLSVRPAEAAGQRQVTWVLGNLPFPGAQLASVEHRVRDFPETSRDDDTRGYHLILTTPAFGGECRVSDSNDPRWWIGN